MHCNPAQEGSMLIHILLHKCTSRTMKSVHCAPQLPRKAHCAEKDIAAAASQVAGDGVMKAAGTEITACSAFAESSKCIGRQELPLVALYVYAVKHVLRKAESVYRGTIVI